MNEINIAGEIKRVQLDGGATVWLREKKPTRSEAIRNFWRRFWCLPVVEEIEIFLIEGELG